MSIWYRVGTVSVANGATAVTGTTTGWINQVKEGDRITFNGGAKWYEIAATPTTNTALTLATAFAEATISGGAYAIDRSSARWSSSTDIAVSLAQIIASYGAPAVGDALKWLRVNAAGTAFEAVASSALFAAELWAVNQNLIINGDFLINQRSFAGGALAGGAYGRDRWKADAGGANYTCSFVTVTLTSGTIVQVVETAAWGYPTLASQAVTVSLADPSADVLVQVGSLSGTITAGSGRRSVTLTLGAGDSGNVSVKLSKSTAGTVTFSRVKMEIGATATPWVARPTTVEQALCMRYCISGAASGYIIGIADNATAWLAQFFQFPVEMRATPTLTFSNPHNADASLAILVGSFRGGTTTPGANSTKGFNAYTTISAGTMATGVPYVGQGAYVATAEL